MRRLDSGPFALIIWLVIAVVSVGWLRPIGTAALAIIGASVLLGRAYGMRGGLVPVIAAIVGFGAVRLLRHPDIAGGADPNSLFTVVVIGLWIAEELGVAAGAATRDSGA
jgi:hypothetical protein